MSDSFWWSLPQNGQTVAGLRVNLQSRQESTMDGQRYRHVLCRTGHSNNLEDALVEDSALTWTCCIASLQFVLKLPLRKKILLILTFLSKSIPAPECAKWAFSGSTHKGHLELGGRAKSMWHIISSHTWYHQNKNETENHFSRLFDTFIHFRYYVGSMNYLLSEFSSLSIRINLHLNKHRFLQNFQFSCLFNTVQTKHMFSGFNTYWFSIFTNISWNKSYCTVFIDISKMAIMFTIYSNVGQKASVLPLCSLASTSETSK